MRFVMAIVAFVVAAVLVGFGIAQRTILLEPATETHKVTTGDAAVTVISGDALTAIAGKQSLLIDGADTVFAAYGRTSDVLAWIGDTTYNAVGFNVKKNVLTSKVVDGADSTVPDPKDSDLWLDEYSQDQWLRFSVNLPSNYSLIITSNGTDPAPENITISWPRDNSTPWAGPLILAGIIIGAIGIALYIHALHQMRKSRGPRRKTPKMPKPPPLPKYKPAKQAAIESAPARGRRSTKNTFIVVPVTLAVALALGGCSSDYWPDFDGDAQPSATATPAPNADADTSAPAVTDSQLEEIVAKAAAVVGAADDARDVEVLKQRMAGPALELRQANYTIRGADSAVAAVDPIPTGMPVLTLPEATDTWPRTVMTVVPNVDDPEARQLLVLVQDTPRDNYRIHYAITMINQKTIDVAPPNVGAPAIKADSKLTLVPPKDLSPDYGSVLLLGDQSPYIDLFEAEGDTLRTQFGVDYKNDRKATLGAKVTIEFGDSEAKGTVLSLSTLESGALVATDLNEYERVRPSEAGSTVSPSGQVKTLSGKESTTTGIEATYGYQLLFYLPPAGSNDKVVLLGFTQGLIAAKEL